MNDGIANFIFIGFALQQIEQAVFTNIAFVIQVHNQTCIQITVIPKLIVKIFLYVMKVFKNFIIRGKSDQCAILFSSFYFLVFLYKNAPLKFSSFFFSVSKRSYFKIIA